MPVQISAGAALRTALRAERPLQIVGAVNAYAALLACRAGFNALYISGAGVANSSFGIPDLGLTTLQDVATDVRRMAAVVNKPILVDADTGWNDPAFTVTTLAAAGAAGIHLEDQVDAKRCGHRPGKRLVATEEMEARLVAAVSAKPDPDFVIMARTDAHAVDGLTAAITRAQRYVAAGADMIFAEALTTVDEFKQFTAAVSVPVLANMTEFGKTPLYSLDQFRDMGVALVLYPLSAFRAMSAAAEHVYHVIREKGSQQAVVGAMQTRSQLYTVLDYERIERDTEALNELIKKRQS